MPLSRALFAIRSLPSRLAGGVVLPTDPEGPLVEQMLATGFCELGRTSPCELVAGVVARLDRRGGSVLPCADRDAFEAATAPGLFKAAMDFRLAAGDDDTLLATETRIIATSPGARHAFAVYWAAIRAGSGAIRREWLRAIARRAELAA